MPLSERSRRRRRRRRRRLESRLYIPQPLPAVAGLSPSHTSQPMSCDPLTLPARSRREHTRPTRRSLVPSRPTDRVRDVGTAGRLSFQCGASPHTDFAIYFFFIRPDTHRPGASPDKFRKGGPRGLKTRLFFNHTRINADYGVHGAIWAGLFA